MIFTGTRKGSGNERRSNQIQSEGNGRQRKRRAKQGGRGAYRMSEVGGGLSGGGSQVTFASSALVWVVVLARPGRGGSRGDIWKGRDQAYGGDGGDDRRRRRHRRRRHHRHHRRHRHRRHHRRRRGGGDGGGGGGNR